MCDLLFHISTNQNEKTPNKFLNKSNMTLDFIIYPILFSIEKVKLLQNLKCLMNGFCVWVEIKVEKLLNFILLFPIHPPQIKFVPCCRGPKSFLRRKKFTAKEAGSKQLFMFVTAKITEKNRSPNPSSWNIILTLICVYIV
jgi:hypothetical protein